MVTCENLIGEFSDLIGYDRFCNQCCCVMNILKNKPNVASVLQAQWHLRFIFERAHRA